MIERIWSGESGLWRLLLPLSWLYGLISSAIRLSYQSGLRKSWRAPLPVVVVGNITAGGSGKTPLVIWLAEQLQQRGVRVGVVSRGYGGKATSYPLLLSHNSCAAQSGDEPLLIFLRTGVPVAVAPDRTAAVRALLAGYSLDLIISDDGLQHYALQRDWEIVVIDGLRRFGNGWWLPAGPMRERIARLKCVNTVITNGGVAQTGETTMQLQPGLAINLVTGEQCLPALLPHVVALAGIGHPARFFLTLENAGVTPEKRISLADHQALDENTLRTLLPAGKTLLMTEKDAVKYRAFAADNWWYLPVTAQLPVTQGEQLLNNIVSLLPAATPNPGLAEN